MFVMGNLLIAIAKILDILFTIYTWIIIAQAIISWVRPDPYNTIVRFLHGVTEPVLRPIRRHLPISWGGFDFSPLIVLLAIIFLQEFLIKSLIQLGYRM
jgi:YggT family protein